MIKRLISKIKSLKKGEVTIIMSPFLIIILSKLLSLANVKTICLWTLITGHHCIGCGITRAIIAILKGDFFGAIELNPLVVIVFPLLLCIWLEYIYKHVFKDI